MSVVQYVIFSLYKCYVVYVLHNRFFILLVCRVGHNEIIGVCRVGIHAEGLGRDHWNEMLAYPRKPIAHWHPLVEPKKSEKEVTICPYKFPEWKSTFSFQYLHLSLFFYLFSSGRLVPQALTVRGLVHPPDSPPVHKGGMASP